MRRVKGTTLWQRLIGAFALCNESFAIYSLSDDDSYPFLLGTNTALHVSFVGSTIIGTLMTSVLPQIAIDSFGVAFYAAFLGLLIPSVKKNRKLIVLVLLTAALNWIFQRFIPASWAVILSMIVGALIGVYFVGDIATSKEQEA